MTVSDVMALLDAERDERGMSNWEKLGASTAGMRSFGIGLTRLRKLAKRIGRDAELAQALWKTDVYDARVIALLVDDPARVTREQAEQQVEELAGGMLAHVFASCDATLAKTPFVVELADAWVRSDDPVRRDCGYGLLYEASKLGAGRRRARRSSSPTSSASRPRSMTEPERVRMAMGTALMGIGKRSAKLNAAALAVARDGGADRVHLRQRRVRAVRRGEAPDHRPAEGEAGVRRADARGDAAAGGRRSAAGRGHDAERARRLLAGVRGG
jgi:hypothetical protein